MTLKMYKNVVIKNSFILRSMKKTLEMADHMVSSLLVGMTPAPPVGIYVHNMRSLVVYLCQLTSYYSVMQTQHSVTGIYRGDEKRERGFRQRGGGRDLCSSVDFLWRAWFVTLILMESIYWLLNTHTNSNWINAYTHIYDLKHTSYKYLYTQALKRKRSQPDSWAHRHGHL